MLTRANIKRGVCWGGGAGECRREGERQRQKEGEMESKGGRQGEGKHEAFRAVSSILKPVLMAEYLNIICNLHNNVKIA